MKAALQAAQESAQAVLTSAASRVGAGRVARPTLMVPMLLGLLVILMALAVVRVKHQNRLLTTDLESLRQQHDRLEMEWSQLQLEEAALAHHARIETLARSQLGMSEPRDYVVVEPAHHARLAPAGGDR